MTRLICFVSILSILIGLMVVKADPVNPENLVKVTPGNHHCTGDAIYCSISQAIDPDIKQYEKLNIVFDNRTWKIASQNKNSSGTTVEYVTNGENVENWNEIVTSQFFPGLQDKVTLKKFADASMKYLSDAGFNPIIYIMENTENKVILEFKIDHPENKIQDELQIITKNDKGIYILHYVIKKADMGQENRDKWLKNLKNSSIKE